MAPVQRRLKRLDGSQRNGFALAPGLDSLRACSYPPTCCLNGQSHRASCLSRSAMGSPLLSRDGRPAATSRQRAREQYPLQTFPVFTFVRRECMRQSKVDELTLGGEPRCPLARWHLWMATNSRSLRTLRVDAASLLPTGGRPLVNGNAPTGCRDIATDR